MRNALITSGGYLHQNIGVGHSLWNFPDPIHRLAGPPQPVSTGVFHRCDPIVVCREQAVLCTFSIWQWSTSYCGLHWTKLLSIWVAQKSVHLPLMNLFTKGWIQFRPNDLGVDLTAWVLSTENRLAKLKICGVLHKWVLHKWNEHT